MLKVDAEWVEIKFEKSHLKCKPNHWFEKTTHTYYDWNKLNRLLLILVINKFISNDDQLIKVVYNWRYSHKTGELDFFH